MAPPEAAATPGKTDFPQDPPHHPFSLLDLQLDSSGSRPQKVRHQVRPMTCAALQGNYVTFLTDADRSLGNIRGNGDSGCGIMVART